MRGRLSVSVKSGPMMGADELVREAEQRLAAAHRHLAHLETELDRLERELSTLEHDVERIDPTAPSSPWPSFLLGLSPPLTVLAAALLFTGGAWPLGLLASVLAFVQVLVLPRLNLGRR